MRSVLHPVDLRAARRAVACERIAALSLAASLCAACSSFHGVSDVARVDATDSERAEEIPGCAPETFGGSRVSIERMALRGAAGETSRVHFRGALADHAGRTVAWGGFIGCESASLFSAAVLRFDERGVPDPSFGVGGRTCVRVSLPAGVVHFMVYDAVEDALHRIVFVGSVNDGGAGSVRAMLGRLTEAGEVDRSFGRDGYVDFVRTSTALDPGTSAVFTSVAMDGDKIVVAGSDRESYFHGTRGFVLRFDDRGAIDRAFGGGAPFVDYDVVGYYGLVVREGVVFTAGTLRQSAGVRAIAIAPSGEPVRTFGEDGFAQHPSGRGLQVRSIGLDARGRVYVAGGRSSVFNDVAAPVTVLRFDPRGAPDMTYGGGEATASDAFWPFANVLSTAMHVRCDGAVFVGAKQGAVSAIVAFDAAGRVARGFGDQGRLNIVAGPSDDSVWANAVFGTPTGALGALFSSGPSGTSAIVRVLP